MSLTREAQSSVPAPAYDGTMTNSLRRTAFAFGALAGLGVLSILVLTLTATARLWPPGERTWNYFLHWGLVAVYELSSLVVVGLDRNSWVVPGAVRTFVGLPLFLVGVGLFVWGARSMDAAETAGLEGELHTDGPYAYTRNPQYVGMILGRVGFVLLANSRLAAVLGALQVGWVSLLPFAEEPWLESRHGEAYARYREAVPRFVGRRSSR